MLLLSSALVLGCLQRRSTHKIVLASMQEHSVLCIINEAIKRTVMIRSDVVHTSAASDRSVLYVVF